MISLKKNYIFIILVDLYASLSRFFLGTRIQINVSWYGSGSGSWPMIRIRNTGFKGARKTITFLADMIKQFRMHYKNKRSWNYLVNWWFYFFINILKTLNWQFVQLDLEFSCIQRKSFCHYIPIWRRPIWMVVFTKQVSTKNLQLFSLQIRKCSHYM